jgi:hypothetical protein
MPATHYTGAPMTFANLRPRGGALAVGEVCYHTAMLNVDAFSGAGAHVWPAHGLQALREHRCIRAADLGETPPT